MKKLKYTNGMMTSTHANLGFCHDMAMLYTNSVSPDIDSVNGCVLLTEDALQSIIKNAFSEGWMCRGEADERKYYSVDDKYTNITWYDIEQEFKRINPSKGIFFHNIAYCIPYCSKEYAMKKCGLDEDTWNKLPKNTQEYFSQEYVKEDTFLGEEIDKWIKS